jgi:hypothetical protein
MVGGSNCPFQNQGIGRESGQRFSADGLSSKAKAEPENRLGF